MAVVRRRLLAGIEPDELGGGMVEDVSLTDYQVNPRFPEREAAGTPNLLGETQLGAVLNVLGRVGMAQIAATEQQRLRQLLAGLSDHSLLPNCSRPCKLAILHLPQPSRSSASISSSSFGVR